VREKQPVLDGTGQNGAPEPPIARAFLYWLEALAGCDSQEELARAVKINSRTLRRFAEGEGGRKTAARIASELDVPLWVVYETMFPAIAAVHGVWRLGRVGEVEACLEAVSQALGAASRISVVALLARVDQGANDGKHLHPADIRVLLRWLESLGDWSKEELARRAGLSRQTLWNYRSGEVAMGRHVLRWLADGVGLPLWLVEGVMLPAITAVSLVVEHTWREERLAGWERALTAAQPTLVDSAHSSVQEILAASRQHVRTFGPSSEDRGLAEDQWRRLKDRSPAERVLLVKNCCELQTWELVERLCIESREAASDSAKVALQLAFLALRVAKLVRGEEFFCLQLQGFAYTHVANAWRVAGRLMRAEEALSRGLELWDAGLATKYALLPAWRLLDLEGSLRRSQHRFTEALELFERAREAAPCEVWGQILLNRAATLDQMVNPTAAIAALDEAAPYVDGEKEPRHLFIWIGIRGNNLCHLQRYQEAQDSLLKAQELGARLGKALDLVRLDWLRGRIMSGVGEPVEALAILTSVQEEFKKLKIAYDYALVSLEVGEILLTERRFVEVKDLALKMEWIFTQEGVHPEAAKALDLFRRAAEGQTATPELARSVVRYLYRAQYDPELKFAA
jgi:tetratricopeptide (TPR) repeat protein